MARWIDAWMHDARMHGCMDGSMGGYKDPFAVIRIYIKFASFELGI